MLHDETIQKVAQIQGLTVTDMATDPGNPNFDNPNFDNNSYIIGRNIYLGLYDDEEIRAASFFHEVGHRLADATTDLMPGPLWKMVIEWKAWEAGLALAAEHGITFGPKVDAYIKKCLIGYYGYK